MSNWDFRFLALADHIATWSKDPSSKVGAVLVRPDRTICTVGFNGFARDMDDAPSIYADRERKVSRVIHAEMNAILTSNEKIAGYTMYSKLCPCDRCTVHAIQKGIRRFVTYQETDDEARRWNTVLTEQYIAEVGGELVKVKRD